MTQEQQKKIYSDIYKRHPLDADEINQRITHKLLYNFVENRLVYGGDIYEQSKYRNLDYTKIIPRIKWPDDSLKKELEQSRFNENKNPVAFLVAGSIVDIESDDQGIYTIYISDDKYLWNNPDDYDRLLNVKRVKSVRYCIVANEFFPNRNGHYSIGDIKSLRPGTRIMMSVYYLGVTSNEYWLKAAFTDIKRCSRDFSYSFEYYDVNLDGQYKLITNNEYYQRFFALAQQKGIMYNSSKSTVDNSKNSGEGCYIATCIYGSYDCPQVWTLRRYRDFILSETWYGRTFIHLYYLISPVLVKTFGNTTWFKNIWRDRLDKMVHHLQKRGIKSGPYDDRH